MGALKDFLETIGTAATNQVLKERLALAASEAESLEKEKARLEARVAQLEEQLKTALQQLSSKAEAEAFVEHYGALFKKTGGVYVKAVYCPSCRISVGSLEGTLPYHCGKCHWMADFTGRDLESIMASLP